MSYAKKISYVSTPYYHYLRHDTSIVSSTSNKQILGSLDAIRFIVQNANPEAASEVAPFTASLTLYMCTRRPAFADRYVDLLMENKEQEISRREDALLEKTDKVEKVLQQAAKVLASNTNYATMVSAPVNSRNTLKFIQLSQVDEEQIVAVIVLGGNVIKNKIIEVGETLSNENLLKLNMLLNTTLNGLSIDQITLGLIARLKEQAGIHSEVVGHVLDAVAEIIHVDNDMEIYTSGATNIFKYPELSDKQSAQEIISAFEEKQQLADLVTETLASEENNGIQVYIGDETPVKTMKDCSVVTATYELGEGMKGTIGIIGPKRMDYEHVMKTLKTLQSELDAIYNKEPKE